MFTTRKVYIPYVSPFDPCPPIAWKTYETPQHLYLMPQQPGLPQFDPANALMHGTLWPAYYNEYNGRVEAKPGEAL